MKRNKDKIEKHPREFWINAIAQWVNDEKARYCLVRRYLDGITCFDIGEELNISESTVNRKIKKYEKILFEHIND